VANMSKKKDKDAGGKGELSPADTSTLRVCACVRALSLVSFRRGTRAG